MRAAPGEPDALSRKLRRRTAWRAARLIISPAPNCYADLLFARIESVAGSLARGGAAVHDPRFAALRFERLEQRNLLSVVAWTGSGDGINWSDPHNWSTGLLPAAGDDVTIAAAGSPTVVISDSPTVRSVTSSDPLDVTTGSFAVTGGTSQLTDGLTLGAGASLTASGSGTSLTATGTTKIDNASLFAQSGASLSLPAVTSDTLTPALHQTFEATGAGSTLKLAGLTSISADPTNTNGNTLFAIDALAGGQVTLSALTQLGGHAQLESDGANSQLDVHTLATFTGVSNGNLASLQATDGGSLLDTALTAPTGVSLVLDGTGTLATGQWTTFTGGTATISGGTPDFSHVANIDNASFLVSGGATVALPAVANDSFKPGLHATLQASGAGSTLAIAGLTSISADPTNANGNSLLAVNALAGGHLTLAALTQIAGHVQLESDGANSQLNVTALTSFVGVGSGNLASIQATSSGTLLDAALTTLNQVNLILDGTGTLATNQWAAYTAGTATISGGTPNFSHLTNISNASFLISGGATVALPAATGDTLTPGFRQTIQASGVGSTLSFAGLTSISADPTNTNGNSVIAVNALAGGHVTLAALTQIAGHVELESNGANSQLDVNALATFVGVSSGNLASLQATGSGSLLDAALTAPNDVNMNLDGTGTLATSQWTAYTGGTATISGGAPNFTNLTNIGDANFMVSGGATVALSAVTGDSLTPGLHQTLQASGTGSTLSLAGLTSISDDPTNTNGNSLIAVNALAGGHLALTALTQIGGHVELESDGANSQLDVHAMATFEGVNGGNLASLQATNSGSLLDTALTAPNEVNLILDGTGTLATSQWTEYTGGTATISGGTPNFTNLTNIGDANFMVSGGATVALPAVTGDSLTPGLHAKLQASGTGSTLSLAELTSISADPTNTDGNSFLAVNALTGGHVTLDALTQIGGHVELESDGAGSQLDVHALANFVGVTSGNLASVQATNSGSLLDVALTAPDEVNLVLDGTGTLATSQWTAYTGGTATISGGTPNFANLTNINNSSFEVSGGATVALPAAAGDTLTPGDRQTWQVSGAGSTLSLASLNTITADPTSTNGDSLIEVNALAGGRIAMPALTQIMGHVDLKSDGAGSQIDVHALTSFSGSVRYQPASMQVTNSGSLLDAALTTLDQVNLFLDGSGTLAIGQWTAYTGGTATISSGTFNFTQLENIDSASFLVSGGATVAMPAGAGDTLTPGDRQTLQATGAGSTLSLGTLSTITGDPANADGNSLIEVNALAGGQVALPALNKITGHVDLESDGAGSELNVDALASILGATNFLPASIQATSSGSLLDAALTSLDRVNLILDGTGTLPTSQWTAYTGGTAAISSGTPNFTHLANIDSASFLVSGGATVALPAAASDTLTPGDRQTLQASGAGSTLSLGNLNTITGDPANANGSSLIEVNALPGGQVALPALTKITGHVDLESDGAGSQLDIHALASFLGADNFFAASLQVTGGGSLLDANLQQLSDVGITTDPGATFTVPPSQSYAVVYRATIQTGTFDNQSSVTVATSAILTIQGNLETDGSGFIGSTGTINLSGSLLGNTQNASQFSPQGTVAFDGAGSAASPQFFEAMSADDGPAESGFQGNFDYGALSLGNGTNTYVKLVDQADNSAGGGPEAVYANSINVPTGTTLDLGGLHLYAHSDSIAGTVLGGTISLVNAPGVSLPGPQTVLQNTPLAVPGISVSDPISTLVNHTFLFTLGVSDGSLTLATNVSGGLTSGEISGNGTNNLTVSATQAQFNATLAAASGLTYRSNTSFTGVDTLSVTADDQNNPTPLIGSGATTIQVQPLITDADSWTGGGDGVNWSDPQNWSTGQVPTASDAVTIAAAGNPTINIAGDFSAGSVSSSDPLDISTGSLTVTSGNSQLSGGLTVSPGASLIVSGSGTTFTASGATVIDGASVSAEGGASLSLPALTSYSATTSTTLEATGAGSVLALANLTSISADASNYAEIAQFEALAGGTVKLPSLTQIDTGPVLLESDGIGSMLNVPALVSFAGQSDGVNAAVQATDGGTVQDPLLTTLNTVNLTLDGSGTILTSQIASFTGGTLAVSGGTPNFNSLNDVDNSSIQVSGGATLSLPAVNSYSYSLSNNSTLEATGAGSILALANLTGISVGSTNYGETAQFEALAGGTVKLPALTQIDTGPVLLESDGAGSVFSIPALASFAGQDDGSAANLQATGGGTVQDPLLTTLNTVDLTLDGTGTISTSQISSYTGGTLAVSGGNPNFSSLADLDDASLQVSGGATLSLPAVNSYTYSLSTSSRLEATGTGSLLTLANLTSVSVGAIHYGEITQFEALAGGTVKLASLAQINTGPVLLESDGAGSVLNISALVSFTGVNDGAATILQATHGSTVQDPLLTTLNTVDLTLDGSGTISTSQISSFTGGTLAVSGGTPNFSGLANIDGASLQVSGGAALSLPAVTSYTFSLPSSSTLAATGTGSLLTMPNLSSVSVGTISYGETAQFEALAGGTVKLPSLAEINTGPVLLESDGTGSVFNIPALVSFAGANDGAAANLQASGGGTVQDPLLTSFDTVNLTLDGTGTISSSQISSFVNGTLAVSGGTPNFGGLANIDGSSLRVSGGATLSLPAVTNYSVDDETTLAATGAGSVLTLADLTGISVDTSSYGETAQFEALAGGRVNLAALAQIDTGPVLLESDGAGSVLIVSALVSFAGTDDGAAPTLQATSGGSVLDSHLQHFTDINITSDSGATFTLASGQTYTVANGATIKGGTFSDQGNLTVAGGAELSVQGNLAIDGSGMIAGAGSIDVRGNLTGNTQNASQFNPPGTVVFDGGETAASPQLLEALSTDDGPTEAGFTGNFDFGALVIYNNTYVKLVDQSNNSSGAGPEAVYADSIDVAPAATLDLNGMHLYVHSATIDGTVLNGTISVVTAPGVNMPGSQSVLQNTPLAVGGISVSDPNGLLVNQTFMFTLADQNGSLTLATNVAGGLTAGDISGNGTSHLTVNATQAQFNATLATTGGLTYQSGAAFSGTDTLTVTADDQNNPNPQSGSGSTNINVQAPFSNVDSWTGGGDGVNWSDPRNWSTGQVPAAGADVTIAAVGNPTIVYSVAAGDSTIGTLTVSDGFSITGGSLTVTGNSTFGGSFSMTGGSLTASGTNVLLAASGATAVSAGSLFALDGATLSLPNLTSYVGGTDSVSHTSTLQALGAGSVLSLPHLTTLSTSIQFGDSVTQIQAEAGGKVDLPAMSQTSGGAIQLLVQGVGSQLNVPLLANLSSQGQPSGLTVSGGTIQDPLLASLDNANLSLDGTGTISTSQITHLTNGTLSVAGGTFNFSGLTDIDNTNVLVSGGASLSLPSVTSFQGGANPQTHTSTLQASGAGSLLSLPHLVSLSTNAQFGDSATQIQAEAGGKVDLPVLTQINGGSTQLLTQGAGSQLNVPLLASLSSQGQASGLTVSGGTIQDPLLTTLDNVNLSLDGTGTVSTSQITHLTNGTLSVAGGTPDFSGLADIDNTNVLVSGGASLSLPSVTSFQGGANPQTHTSTLQASGVGSLLSLPHLISLSTNAQFGDSATQIQAETGGKVDLPVLTQINGGSTQLLTQGAGSQLNVPLLASLSSQGQASGLTVSGGTIQDPLLTTLDNVNLSIDGTGTISTSQIIHLTNGTLSVAGGTPNFSGLTDIDNTNVLVSGGASLSLPSVTSFQGGANPQTHTSTLQASGVGSLLSLPHLVSLSTNAQFGDSATQIQAETGGNVDLPVLTQINGGSTQLLTQGAGSQLNVPLLASLSSQGQASGLTVNGGLLNDPLLTSLDNVSLSLDGTGTLSTSQFTHLTDSTLTVTAGNPNFSGLTDIDNTSVLVSGGATVNLPGVTSFHGGASPQLHTSMLQASGAGSLLSLPQLTALATNTTFGDSTTVAQAEAGGRVNLPVLTQIGGSASQLVSEGAGSQLNVPLLASFLVTSGQGLIQVTTGGSLLDGNLRNLTNVGVDTDSAATATIAANQTDTINTGTTVFTVATLVVQGGLAVASNANLQIQGNLEVDGAGFISGSEDPTTIFVSGNLLGSTQNANQFSPQGAVDFDGSGTAASPQLLEAMSANSGPVQSGFQGNFTYGTLELSNNTYVKLVDLSHNSSSSGPEALYADSIDVPAGTTLDLNGLNVYVHNENIPGTVIGGTIIQVTSPGVSLPAAQSVDQNVPLAIVGASVFDPNPAVAGNVFQVIITAQHGNVTLSTSAAGGLTAGQITGNGTASVTINSTLAQLNATLAAANGLVYQSSATFSGTDALHVVADDENPGDPQTGSGSMSITVNAPAPPIPPAPPPTTTASAAISIADSQGSNSATAAASLAFTVTLSAPSLQTVTVDYTSANGTGPNGAIAGIDYTAVSGTLTFSPGVVEQTFFVTLPTDAVAESNKTFFIDLANPNGAGISQAQAIGTILSGAAAPPGTNPGITIGQVEQRISPTGAADFVFNLSLLAASTQPVRVTYVATIGAPGSSFAFTSTETVTFAPGTTTQQITVQSPLGAPILSDLNFSVSVIGAQSAFIASGQAAQAVAGGPTFPAVYLQSAPTVPLAAPAAPSLAPVYAALADETPAAALISVSQGAVVVTSDTMTGGDVKTIANGEKSDATLQANAAVDAVLEAFLDPHLLGNAAERNAETLLQSLADFDEMRLVSIDLGDDVIKKPEQDRKRERVVVNRLPTEASDEALALAGEDSSRLSWVWSWPVVIPLSAGSMGSVAWVYRKQFRRHVAALRQILGL